MVQMKPHNHHDLNVIAFMQTDADTPTINTSEERNHLQPEALTVRSQTRRLFALLKDTFVISS